MKSKIKKSTIVLILSLLILITLIVIYFVQSAKKKAENAPVSLREQYQQELLEKENSDND